ncbi:hypothetical protein G7046_g10168 [Stylonectria norvegica]|nr:hypothetical protein G7046_g10168 [Stylonectria norvegica]
MPPKGPPTHFLCIPLAGAQLARTLSSFRADVTSAMSFAVPQEAVRPLGTLHLTLGVMSLKDDGVDRAVELLKSLRPRDVLAQVRALGATKTANASVASEAQAASELRDLTITLQGLHPMQAASKTSVLYAPPNDSDGILYRFCEQIKKAFQDAGLMEEENRPLLLHATIINTIYVKSGRGKRRERLTLDARDLLSRYDDYVWIEGMPVERVAICRMGAKKVEGADDAAYEVEAEVKF